MTRSKMGRKFTENKLVLATHNGGKIKEISSLLSPYVQDFVSAGDLGLSEPEETEDSFTGNAILKARYASKESGLVALADDSGLSVTALKGAPGIYSARWAGENKDFMAAMQKIHDRLGDTNEGHTNKSDRSAAFICVMALAWPDGHVETFEGRIDGQLIWPLRRKDRKGFGYDPMFVPEGHKRSFAAMRMEEKQEISHRARAFAFLVESCFV